MGPYNALQKVSNWLLHLTTFAGDTKNLHLTTFAGEDEAFTPHDICGVYETSTSHNVCRGYKSSIGLLAVAKLFIFLKICFLSLEQYTLLVALQEVTSFRLFHTIVMCIFQIIPRKTWMYGLFLDWTIQPTGYRRKTVFIDNWKANKLDYSPLLARRFYFFGVSIQHNFSNKRPKCQKTYT